MIVYIFVLLLRNIQDTMKGMWRKLHKFENNPNKQGQNRRKYKSFLADSQMYCSYYLQGKVELAQHYLSFNTFHFETTDFIFQKP